VDELIKTGAPVPVHLSKRLLGALKAKFTNANFTAANMQEKVRQILKMTDDRGFEAIVEAVESDPNFTRLKLLAWCKTPFREIDLTNETRDFLVQLAKLPEVRLSFVFYFMKL